MISAVVIAKNEEKRLKKCLDSLKWCQEIVVIDNNSIDKTIDIAKRAKAKVYSYHNEDDFAALRNFGLEKASNDWVFFVDADEVVSPELANEIYQHTSQFVIQVNGFYVVRKDNIWGKTLRYGDSGKIKLLRLARKEKGQWVGKVHEVWEVLGDKGTLKNHLIHFPHQTISEFLREINYYSTLRSQELFDRKIKSHWWDIIVYPKAKFFYNYFIKMGFRDGIAGIVHALMMSYHSFLVRSKLWQMRDRK